MTCYLHNLFYSHRSSLTGLLMTRVRVRRWAVTPPFMERVLLVKSNMLSIVRLINKLLTRQKLISKVLKGLELKHCPLFNQCFLKTMSWSESNWMKVLTFSSRPQTACFHVVNGRRTAVVNRKLRKYADESSCHAGHTMRFCRRLPSTVLLRKVPII